MSSTKLTQRWTLANQRLKTARANLNSAECEVMNVTNALGNHIAPRDMKCGEKIGVWVRFDGDYEAIVEVVKRDDGGFELSMRDKRSVPQ